MKQSSTKSPSLCRITDDDDALMRVISVCFSNVHSFLWLNHLISWIMTDKNSVVSTPEPPDLGCVWSLVTKRRSRPRMMEITLMMMGTVLMTGSRLTRLSEMTGLSWGDRMGKQSEPTFPLRRTNSRQDTWYHWLEARVWSLDMLGWKYKFPMCVRCCCVVPSVSFCVTHLIDSASPDQE